MNSTVAVLLAILHLNWLLSTLHLMIYFPGLRFTGIFVILHTVPDHFFCIFSAQASSWGAEKTKIPSCGCVLTCAGCSKGSSSLVLCALLTNPNTRNCFLSSKVHQINAQTQAPPCWIYFSDAWLNWGIHLQWLSSAMLVLTHLEMWEHSFVFCR